MSDFLRILAIFLLVLGNAVFVAAEYALVTARRSRLEPEAEAGSRRARAALDLMEHPVRFISTVQIGITVFGIALGAVGQPLLSGYFDPWLSHGARLPARVPDPHLPQRHARRARAEGARAPEGGDDREDARVPARDPPARGRRPSSGCCRSRRTRSPGSSACNRRRRASSPTPRRTSATSSPAPRTRA